MVAQFQALPQARLALARARPTLVAAPPLAAATSTAPVAHTKTSSIGAILITVGGRTEGAARRVESVTLTARMPGVTGYWCC